MDSSDLKDVLTKNQEVLDKYEQEMLGIPDNQPPGTEEELQEYLNMSVDVIEQLSAERALSISIRLSQFSFYIQRSINKHKSMLTWTTNELNKRVAQEIIKYDKFTKTDIKIAQICSRDPHALQILNMQNYASQVIDRLSELSGGIKNLSYVFSLAHKSKIGDRNE